MSELTTEELDLSGGNLAHHIGGSIDGFLLGVGSGGGLIAAGVGLGIVVPPFGFAEGAVIAGAGIFGAIGGWLDP